MEEFLPFQLSLLIWFFHLKFKIDYSSNSNYREKAYYWSQWGHVDSMNTSLVLLFNTPAINKGFDNLHNMDLTLNLVYLLEPLFNILHINAQPKIMVIFKITEHM